jgi:NAD(P)-dependent dehydrogenase (short-subunit alcohol dehydrogenase family)
VSGVLEGRVAIITGGSHGLGFEVARTYVQEGAKVVLCARDHKDLESARAGLLLLGDADSIAAVTADISREEDVARIVARTLELFSRIDVLVSNAGIYGPKGLIDEVPWTEWVRAIEVNLYGSVLMCRAVVPHMRRQSYGKIVQLSGGGATSPMPQISAYAASKAAVVRFAETLALEVRSSGIDVNSIAPGALNTRMLDEVLAAGPEGVGQAYYDRAMNQKTTGGAPMERAAALAVFLGSAASDGITGKLLSAIWDPWEDLPEHRADLESDVYTLRRIVPKDRGFDWGDR